MGSRLLKRYQTISYFYKLFKGSDEDLLIPEKHDADFCLRITSKIRPKEMLAMYSYLEVNVPVEGSLNKSLNYYLSRAALCRHLEFRYPIRRENN
jgi:hypothetical protein